MALRLTYNTYQTHYLPNGKTTTACWRIVAPMAAVQAAARAGSRAKVPTGQTTAKWHCVTCALCLHNDWHYTT